MRRWRRFSTWIRTPWRAAGNNCSITTWRQTASAGWAAAGHEWKKTADIVNLIEFLLEYDTAGDPITGVKWSRRTPAKVAMALGDFGITVSANTVARLLQHMGYSLHVNQKHLATDASPDRNEQFLYISDLRDRFERRGLPIISIDTNYDPCRIMDTLRLSSRTG